MAEQPIAIELMPSADRASVVVLLRSGEPIPLHALIETLGEFVRMLTEKYPTSKIERVNKPKIITP